MRFITLMMEAVHPSETSVHFVTIWRYIPEDSKLYAHHPENLKYHISQVCYFIFYSRKLQKSLCYFATSFSQRVSVLLSSCLAQEILSFSHLGETGRNAQTEPSFKMHIRDSHLTCWYTNKQVHWLSSLTHECLEGSRSYRTEKARRMALSVKLKKNSGIQGYTLSRIYNGAILSKTLCK
jgi:hypothetical protein